MSKLKRVFGPASAPGPAGWIHWCPGCGSAHMIWVEQANEESGARWTFDGNEAAPTFAPSIRVYHWSKYKAGKKVEGATQITDCHYFLRGGQLQYCKDSRHALAGQTVPLPDYDE